MPAEIVHIYDYERRSRNPDAYGPRDRTEVDAIVIVFPKGDPHDEPMHR